MRQDVEDDLHIKDEFGSQHYKEYRSEDRESQVIEDKLCIFFMVL